MTKTPDIQTIRQVLADISKIRSVDEYRNMLRLAVDEIERLGSQSATLAEALQAVIEDERKKLAKLERELSDVTTEAKRHMDEGNDLKAQLDAKTQELDLMRQVADTNADEALKARAERDAIRGQLDAKDTEIAGHLDQIHRRDVTVSVLQGNLDSYVAEGNRLREIIAEMQRVSKSKDAQIAERDATIAKMESVPGYGAILVLKDRLAEAAAENEALRKELAERKAIAE